MSIPIFLSSDNNYAPFVATTIASMCNNTEAYINIFVLDGGISEENKNSILELKQKFKNFSLEFLEIDIEKNFYDLQTRMHFTKSMFSRFLIPSLKPELNKVLYSDVDVIVLGDIAKMYEEDLQNYTIAAVWESFNEANGNNDKRKRDLNLSSVHKYFASGNLIIDSKKWREKNITQELLKIAKEYKNVLQFADQDILNIYFDNNYKILDSKYCTETLPKQITDSSEIIIRHYQSGFKPWHIHPSITTNLMPNLDDFWHYAKMTAFYEELLANVKYKTLKDLMLEMIKNKR